MTNTVIVNNLDFKELVMLSGDQVITNSLKVAEAFNRRHKDTLRAIRNLKCSDEFTRRNFAPTDFIDKNGDIQPMYNMTKDGCIFLIMGFTGEQAAAIKEAYINAFNWMAEMLQRGATNLESERNAVMLEYMKERDAASVAGRVLNSWGRDKKPQLVRKIAQIQSKGQILIPGLPEP